MAFPSNPARRKNRRRSPRNQTPFAIHVATAVTGTGSTVTLTFASPINVAGTIPMTVGGTTLVTQTVVSPTVVTQLRSGAITGLAWNLPSPITNVSTYEGGVVVGGSGTFP